MTLVLKTYAATATDRGTGLTCPRRKCGGKFVVNLDSIRERKAATDTKTITCPYCSKVSLIPPTEG